MQHVCVLLKALFSLIAFLDLRSYSKYAQASVAPVKCYVQCQQDIFLICHCGVFGLKGQPV